MDEKRKPVRFGTLTLYMTDTMRRFRRREVTLTRDVEVTGLLPETLKAGRKLRTAPLYPQHPGFALSEDGGVMVALSPGGKTSCWVPAGSWE